MRREVLAWRRHVVEVEIGRIAHWALPCDYTLISEPIRFWGTDNVTAKCFRIYSTTLSLTNQITCGEAECVG